MPNRPATPNRNVRISDDLWEAAQQVADDRGETMSQFIRRLLREAVRASGRSVGGDN